MSDFDELIKKRRSIRKYKPDLLSTELIEKMIFAATLAPSPSNTQPVRFVRISSGKTKEKLHQALIKGHKRFLAATKPETKRLKAKINAYRRFSEFMFKAPALFAVGYAKNVPGGFSKILFEAGIISEDKRSSINYDITIGLCLKNFILKGEDMGISSCILTGPLVFIPNAEEICGIDDIFIRCFLTAGYPDEKPGFIERKKVSEIYRSV